MSAGVGAEAVVGVSPSGDVAVGESCRGREKPGWAETARRGERAKSPVKSRAISVRVKICLMASS